MFNCNDHLEVAQKSQSTENMAALLMLKFFSTEELTISNVNVRGISMNKKEKAVGLDPKRVELIRRYCLDRSDMKDEPDKAWSKCVSAMNKKIFELKKENEKQLNNQA